MSSSSPLVTKQVMKPQRKLFLQNLKLWSAHCSLTALPSFLLAGFLLQYFQNLTQVTAMLIGIGLFILGYASLSTFLKPLRNKKSLLSQALSLALKLRLAVSVLSLPFVLYCIKHEDFIFWIPDYWSGWTAAMILTQLEHLLEYSSFAHTLIWTLLEGAIISFFLFMTAFFCLLIVNKRQKKKIILQSHSPVIREKETPSSAPSAGQTTSPE